MRLLFEITCVFINCVLLSLSCVVYAYPKVRSRFRGGEITRRQECMCNLMLVVPFGLFALGAVIHTQLHHGMLARLPGLLIVALFVIYPLICLSIVILLEERCRRIEAIRSGWGRPVDLSQLIKNKEVS